MGKFWFESSYWKRRGRDGWCRRGGRNGREPNPRRVCCWVRDRRPPGCLARGVSPPSLSPAPAPAPPGSETAAALLSSCIPPHPPSMSPSEVKRNWGFGVWIGESNRRDGK